MKSITIHGLSLQFDAEQITHGSDDDQARQAVELINLALQREPFGLGAQLILHPANILPEVVAALEMTLPAVEYHHEREGCPITLSAVREAIRHANHINPPMAFCRRPKKKGQHHGRTT